mmetsp:Transcript_34429/g.97556  ORF Transcript_34429/g.97556 Transcript_34429/m.97556 type:complete len:233 (-) Transcript_34429:4252-4950(-)
MVFCHARSLTTLRRSKAAFLWLKYPLTASCRRLAGSLLASFTSASTATSLRHSFSRHKAAAVFPFAVPRVATTRSSRTAPCWTISRLWLDAPARALRAAAAASMCGPWASVSLSLPSCPLMMGTRTLMPSSATMSSAATLSFASHARASAAAFWERLLPSLSTTMRGRVRSRNSECSSWCRWLSWVSAISRRAHAAASLPLSSVSPAAPVASCTRDPMCEKTSDRQLEIPAS